MIFIPSYISFYFPADPSIYETSWGQRFAIILGAPSASHFLVSFFPNFLVATK